MELNPTLTEQAMAEALARFPEFAGMGARLVARPLHQGVAYILEWDTKPGPEMTNAWEFQNAAVKAYRRLAAVSLEANRLGLYPGQKATDAMALVPELAEVLDLV